MGRDKELDLIRSISEGREDALEELMVAYQKPVFAVALRLLGNAQAAEDVVQETFLAVWSHAGDFRGDASLKSWVFSIAVNKARTAWRWRKVRSLFNLPFATQETEEGETVEIEMPDKSREADPAESAARLDASERVQKAIDGLPQRQREIVMLRAQGLELLEIAKATGLAEGTVKATLHQARGKLEDMLGGEL